MAAQKIKKEKKLQEKKRITDEFVKRKKANSAHRNKFKKKLYDSSDIERFTFVIEQDKLPLAAFPTEWTKLTLEQAFGLPIELRVAVLERIKAKSKGPWRELAKLIKKVERENNKVYLNQ